MRRNIPKQTEIPEGVSPPEAELRLPIVGVGASAGGIEALKELLRAVPRDSGAAFIVVQHLDPTHESQMAQLLAGHTPLRVLQAEEGMAVEPDTAYTIPPGYSLSLREGRLHLDSPRTEQGLRMPIDHLFRSLASELEDRAIGVILSGSGTDGTLGVRAVRGAGGLAIAQDPETAEYDSMPRSAIATSLVDFVLPPREIPAVVLRYVHDASSRTEVEVERAAGPPPDELDEVLQILLRARADFRGYKLGTLLRRVQRRMGINQLRTLARYLQLLRERPDEVAKLAKDMLIGVTSFFRDPEAYQELRTRALVPLVQANENGVPLRVWVAGCSTGEEAYSLAILLLEELEAARKSSPLMMFASDLDEEALTVARAGVYPESIAADVSPDRLARFFLRQDHSYRIVNEVRDSIVLSSHNLVSDPPFSRMDLVSCRNVLIYLGTELQQRLTSLLAFALNPGGYLFLGRADSLPDGAGAFDEVSRGARIYRRTVVPRHEPVQFPALARREPLRTVARRGGVEAMAPPVNVMALGQRLLLDHFAAAMVLIDDRGAVLYVYGDADKYLRLPAGRLDLDLFAMAREKLSRRLRGAVRRALEKREPVRLERLPVGSGAGASYTTVTVQPALEPPAAGKLLAVIFEEVPGPGAASAPAEAAEGAPETPLVGQLEAEIRGLREELGSAAAEYATSLEELQATYEEAVSMDEELRATNEELETSKEELQSVNEELVTLNAELRDRIREAGEVNSDLVNLFSATEVATVFLDRDLRIRRYTPKATELFSLLSVDVGRPIAHIAPRFRGSDLVGKAEQVLRDLTPQQHEVETPEGGWYLMRVLPYRSLQDRVEGVVVTFADITSLKQAEQESEEARIYAEGIVATVREPLLVLDPDLRIVSANSAFYRTFHVSPEETLGRPLPELGNRQWGIPGLIRLLAEVIPQQAEVHDFEVEHDFPGLGRRSMLLNARRIDRGEDRPALVLLAIEDITQRKRVAEAMISEISHHTKNNLAIVAGLLQLQADERLSEGVNQSLIRDAITRIRTFASLHELLHAAPSEEVELVEALRRVANIARTTLAPGRVEIEVEGEPILYPFQDSADLAVVANELITNALKHGAPDATGALRVKASVRVEEGNLVISVWNSGNPVSHDLDLAAVRAGGLLIVKSVVEDHCRGRLTLQPHEGGTLAEVVIPRESRRRGKGEEAPPLVGPGARGQHADTDRER